MGGSDGETWATDERRGADRRERDTLERWARRPKSSQALALRCRSYWPVRMRSAPNGDTLPIERDSGDGGQVA